MMTRWKRALGGALVMCALGTSAPAWACKTPDVGKEYEGVSLEQIEGRLEAGEMGWAMAAAMWRYELSPKHPKSKIRDIDPKDEERVRAAMVAALGAVYSGGVFYLDHKRHKRLKPAPEANYRWARGVLRDLVTLYEQPSPALLDAFAQVYLFSPDESERAHGLAMSVEALEAGRITSGIWLARLASHPELSGDSRTAAKKACTDKLGKDHPSCESGPVDSTKATFAKLCNIIAD